MEVKFVNELLNALGQALEEIKRMKVKNDDKGQKKRKERADVYISK